MRSAKWAVVCVGALGLVVVARTEGVLTGPGDLAARIGAAPSMMASHAPAGVQAQAIQRKAATPIAKESPDEIVDDYCVDCHNDLTKSGGWSFEAFDLKATANHADMAERMVRKLQAGMMPPPGTQPPDPVSYQGLITALETRLDVAAAARPNPGTRPFQRLNRAEFSRTIKDLLALDVNAGDWLPLDSMSANFDNIADEQAMSATMLEAFLNAAADISRMAVGDPQAPKLDKTYNNTSLVSQHPWDYVEGAPYGTRGGMVVRHVFPADGEYQFDVVLTGGNNSRGENIDVSINGERVALVRYETQGAGSADGRGGVAMRTEPVTLRAGQHLVAAAFERRMDGPYEDLIRPHDWSYAGGGSGGAGVTTLPHVRDLVIRGPLTSTGLSETPSRQRIFVCRPTAAADERACARKIIDHLGARAFRRPMSAPEADAIMQFYDIGSRKGGFENGVRTTLEAILSSPFFIFRLEKQPAGLKPGAIYRVADVDLASRLSFFLWGTVPDEELMALARRGELALPATIEKQARRMLADPRAGALGSRFAGQWLRLQDIDKVNPDPNFFPNFDDHIARAMKRETETFFNALVREDRSALDLYRADFTFVDERLARHYGFAGVAGSEFRRITYPDDTRRGLLGQGSMLVQTSYANRTSPVLRGKWVMEVLLGTPPPPPPQDGSVKPFEETAESKNGKPLTTRERMEAHRDNEMCRSCHRFIDPIGLALDNFDVTAKWRIRENGSTLDTAGVYYDGTAISTPAQLSAVLLKRPVPLMRTFTENLLAYAVGRRTEYYDQPTIRAIARAAAANDYRMSSFILGVVKSDAFRLKRVEAPNAPAAKPIERR